VSQEDTGDVGSASVRPNVRLAVIAVFAALIALGTVLSIPLPPPLFEITWSPAIYLALAALTDQWSAFSATAIGSFLGEAYNVAYKAGGSPIYPFGMVWARAPEVLIVAWASKVLPSPASSRTAAPTRRRCPRRSPASTSG
jgi:hypothetical protein